MSILGLDLGSDCGWIRIDSDGVTSGTFKTKKSKVPIQDKMVAFYHWLAGQTPVDVICFEYVEFHKSHYASRAYWSFWCILQLLARFSGAELRQCTPSDVKKHATGKGNAGKPDMMAALKTKFGYSAETEDEGDAIWILSCFFPKEVEEAFKKKRERLEQGEP